MNFRIALVTGASRGLGREIARRLAKEVSGVAVHYYRSRPEAEKLAAEIKDIGKLCGVFAADLRKKTQAQGLVKKVEDKFGRVDILVNNVGPLRQKPWDQLDLADWEEAIRGNLLSSYFCLRAVLPGMKERKWGRIINIGFSRVEQQTYFPTILPYSAAKSGLLLLTRTAAVAVQPYGITVNMVSPGLITGGVLPSLKPADETRVGLPNDVAEAVAFLTSDKANAITGTNLIVAGTWKM